jgi:hypothetical protein
VVVLLEEDGNDETMVEDPLVQPCRDSSVSTVLVPREEEGVSDDDLNQSGS